MIRYCFFNESADLIPEKLCLGTSYEDRSVYAIEDKFKEYEFILDAVSPGLFIAVSTGNYLYNDEKGEYYDNLNNKIYLVKKSVWNECKVQVILNEKRIYDEYKSDLPKWLLNLLNDAVTV